MPMWLLVLFAAIAATLGLFALLLRLTGGQSDAGIVTSRAGRSLRVAGNGTRLAGRHLWRTIRRWFTPRAQRQAMDARYHEETAQAVLTSMGNMKGVMMKLGQIVSFMDETLPEAYQEQLKKLQAQAPPMSYDTVERVIKEELGKEPDLLFARFDRAPLASASIGQVHRAQLIDGTEVVVKVQYPGVGDAIRADLKNTGMLMMMVQTFSPNMDARAIVDELSARILEELDYVQEATNQEEMGALYQDHETVVVPRVFRSRSSGRVLTTEYQPGQTFYEFLEHATDAQKNAAVMTMREFVFDSLWFHNLFNGDPHPGNYIFMEGGRIAFIDFGCVKRFSPRFMDDFRVLNHAYLTGDKDAYFSKACEMQFIKPGYEHKVTSQWLWDYARWFYLPLLEDADFAFTPDYCSQALSQLFGENMTKLNMPPEYVVLNRITFGLNSILSRMQASANWRRLSKQYYFPNERDPLTGV